MKSKFKVLLLIAAFLCAGIYLSSSARSAVLLSSASVLHNIKAAFSAIQSTATKYFATTEEIDRLRAQNEQLQQLRLQLAALEADYEQLRGSKKPALNVSLVRINSYERLGDKKRFWAQSDVPSKKDRGLVADDQALGVLTHKEGREFAIALADANCAIAAKIGAQSAIVRGDGRYVWADFVEDYALIIPGAQVATSGMDGIFPAGVKIGEVASVEQRAGYKRALVKNTASLWPYRFVYATSPR